MHTLIMAGGLGTRFWPKSRREHPKHLLKIRSEKTLIQNTFNRLSPIVQQENIFVVSTGEQIPLIRKQLSLPSQNYIREPLGKSTAPCIGLAAVFLQKIDPDAVMAVLPADHLILDEALFQKTMKAGEKLAAESDSIVTIGILPTYPATGYGYIQSENSLPPKNGIEVFDVKTFAEKPNLETAKLFLECGDFLWNSGIFIWKIKTILAEIEKNIPVLYQGLQEISEAIGSAQQEETIDRVYRQIRSISIDYGVMEQADNVKVLKGTFGWNDLGSWEELYKLGEKNEDNNVLIGSHLLEDSKGCYIDSPKRTIALLGVDDLIVVDTGDATLICPREKAQEVKQLVELAKRKKMNTLL